MTTATEVTVARQRGLAETILTRATGLAERGYLPAPLLRAGVRRLCAQRLTSLADGPDPCFLETMESGPVALVPELANEQHYEVPSAFFGIVLGPARKYSSCYWAEGTTTLAEAETDALSRTCRNAGLRDGQTILELGCGWGSLTLWMAEKYPGATITAVSNSSSQRSFIMSVARARGLANVEVITTDVNDLQLAGRFDRIVSVEMFEHMRNYRELFGRIAGWLEPDGRLFTHVFCHDSVPYPFETEGPGNWMGREFFSGGLMPSADLFRRFDDHLEVVDEWRWSGTHYQKTADAWLANLETRRDAALPILAETYGPENARQWYHRWRIFFIACSELFGFEEAHGDRGGDDHEQKARGREERAE